ncbi:hypothetical protein ACFL6I_17425 [candidate division KSB1 bacterium]
MKKLSKFLKELAEFILDFLYPPDRKGNKYQSYDGTLFRTKEELKEYNKEN